VNVVFDDLDVFYLANELSLPQLRHEIRHANMMVAVDAAFDGTTYADTTPFPWAEFAECCREAVCAIQEHNQQNPQPAAPGHRIDAADIKARADIVSIVEQYTRLRKTGHNRFVGQYPLHEDKHPSMTVYADNQSWHCFQCNKGGDVFDFIMAVNSCDFKEALECLA
jgi:hypothetical protein